MVAKRDFWPSLIGCPGSRWTETDLSRSSISFGRAPAGTGRPGNAYRSVSSICVSVGGAECSLQGAADKGVDAMSKRVQARDGGEGGARPEANEAAKDAPRQWIYRNLTPWRIHACFGENGDLVSREKLHPQVTKENGQAGDEPSNVLSIPALGEVTLPREDAQRLNTIKMRRLGQIEVRPAPSEFSDESTPSHRHLRLAAGRPRLRGVGALLRWRERTSLGVGGGGAGCRAGGRSCRRHRTGGQVLSTVRSLPPGP